MLPLLVSFCYTAACEESLITSSRLRLVLYHHFMTRVCCSTLLAGGSRVIQLGLQLLPGKPCTCKLWIYCSSSCVVPLNFLLYFQQLNSVVFMACHVYVWMSLPSLFSHLNFHPASISVWGYERQLRSLKVNAWAHAAWRSLSPKHTKTWEIAPS